MKRTNYLLIALSVILIITSCSGIKRYTTYHPYEENNKWENQYVRYSNVNYIETEKDTLFLRIIPDYDGLFAGPVLVPVIPICLAPWAQGNWSKLEIELWSTAIEEYGIDSTNIHFIINNKKEIYPIKISQKQGEKVFYFAEKMKKIKKIEIFINSTSRQIPPLFLKRKYEFEYIPLIT